MSHLNALELLFYTVLVRPLSLLTECFMEPVMAGVCLFIAESPDEDRQPAATSCSSQGRQGEQRLPVGAGSLSDVMHGCGNRAVNGRGRPASHLCSLRSARESNKHI